MDPVIWSNVEISVGIICACLPVLRPVFQAAKRKLFGEPTAATWRSSQISSNVDEIIDLEENPKVQSANLARRAEGYLVMSGEHLPDRPAAADGRRNDQRAEFRSAEKETWRFNLGEDDVAKEQVGAQEYRGADAV